MKQSRRICYAILIVWILGALSYFSVRIVISTSAKGAVLADARTVEEGAINYCNSNECSDDQELTWNEMSYYIYWEGYQYENTGNNDTTPIARLVDGEWKITLERRGDGTQSDEDWEFVSNVTPSKAKRSHVTDDNN